MKFQAQGIQCSSLPWATALIGTVSLVGMIPGVAEVLELSRGTVADGEWWRLATGHLVHYHWNHFLWDVTVFLVLAGTVEVRHGRAFLLSFLLGGSLLVSVFLLQSEPSMEVYRGLSSLDTMLFLHLTVAFLARSLACRDGVGVAAALLLASSVLARGILESLTGAPLFVQTADTFQALPQAHLAGGLLGGLSALYWHRPATIQTC